MVHAQSHMAVHRVHPAVLIMVLATHNSSHLDQEMPGSEVNNRRQDPTGHQHQFSFNREVPLLHHPPMLDSHRVAVHLEDLLEDQSLI